MSRCDKIAAACLCLFALCASVTAGRQSKPALSVQEIQVSPAGRITIHADGFVSKHAISLHVRGLEQTQEFVVVVSADERGAFTYGLDAWQMKPGTSEIWAVDDAAGMRSNTAHFTVGFGANGAVVTEAKSVIAPYVGVWRGDSGRDAPAIASLVLLSFNGNAQSSGTVVYTSLACGGDIALRTVASDYIEFVEAVTYGADRCVSGIITVRAQPSGSLSFEWRHPTLPGNATGELHLVKR